MIQPGNNPCSGMLVGSDPPAHSQVLPLYAVKLTPALLCPRHTKMQKLVAMEQTCVEV